MVLVDTNVVVALLVRNTPWFAHARALFERDGDWRSESHALVELSSVMTRYVRVGEIDVVDASRALGLAEQHLRDGLLLAPHAEAMRTALTYGVSAYDARFLVVAQHLGAALVTEDRKLRHAAPRLTQSLEEVLAGG